LTPSIKGQSKDLIVLVADKNLKAALTGILNAHERLGAKRMEFDVFVHPKSDPGVYRSSHEFLRPLQRLAPFCLAVFDRDGCGGTKTRELIEIEVESRLAQSGWEGRSAAIVIEPELEIWLWSDSPHVDTALGWPRDGSLKRWLIQNGYWLTGEAKPRKPKEGAEAALRRTNIPRSSAIYLQIARQVSLESCTDPAFIKLKNVLCSFFPATQP